MGCVVVVCCSDQVGLVILMEEFQRTDLGSFGIYIERRIMSKVTISMKIHRSSQLSHSLMKEFA